MFAVELLARTLLGHHVLAVSEIGKLMEAIAWSLLTAGMVWMLYVALEPYVRRLWPECLIAWSRLVAGRFRDPLVGRDVLLGGAARAALLPLVVLPWASYGWLGLAPSAPFQAPLGLLCGLGFGLADLLFGARGAFAFPLVLLFLLLLLRIVLRRQWLAVTVIVGVSMVFGGVQSEYPWIDGPVTGLATGVLLFVLLRLGLVALISSTLLGVAVFAVPVTTDLSVWYAWPSLLLLGLVFALYAYAFYISLAGRPIFRGSILPE